LFGFLEERLLDEVGVDGGNTVHSMATCKPIGERYFSMDAPDIRPDNPAFLYTVSGRIPD
jgi:hypothetical protein